MALKTVLITGCSAGGIGSALVSSFQKRNLHVFATARDLSKMAHLENLPDVTLLHLDPTSASSVDAAVERVSGLTGGTPIHHHADPGLRHRHREEHVRDQHLGPDPRYTSLCSVAHSSKGHDCEHFFHQHSSALAVDG